MTKCIIPCAGRGTRMGLKPHEAKELLPDPKTDKPLIEYSLELCKTYNLDPFVITNSEKKSFNKYLIKNEIPHLIVETTTEWTDSVLQSKGYWNEHNILLLPDTRFSPESVLKDIEVSMLLGCKSVLALHKVPDSHNWGIVKDYGLFEKPKFLDATQEYYAWGVLGFHIDVGQNLFRSMEYTHLNDTGFFFLKSFKDLTRDPKDMKPC